MKATIQTLVMVAALVHGSHEPIELEAHFLFEKHHVTKSASKHIDDSKRGSEEV